MKKITILIPCHNEEGSLISLYPALEAFTKESFEICPGNAVGESGQVMDMRNFDWEFLFVDDGSSDSTFRILQQLAEKDPRIGIIKLSRNFGKENAMLAGFDHVSGDAVITIDADLQDPLEAIPEMIYWWEKGYQDVYGERISRGKESALRKSFSLMFYRLIEKSSDIDTLPNVGDFRLLDRSALNALTSLRETQRYTKGLFCWIGFNKKKVRFNRNNRESGESSYSFLKLLNLAVDGLTSYTTAPLRIAIVAGALVSLCAFIYLAAIFIKTLIWSEPVAGFPSLMCVILFLGGFQLLALGIIGEYMGRIFNEVKRRPPYIVESYSAPKKDI